MVVYVIDDWSVFIESVATCRYKLYRIKNFGNSVIIQAKAGRLGFEKEYDIKNPKEKDEFEKILEDIKVWGFVEVKKIVSDEEFFY